MANPTTEQIKDGILAALEASLNQTFRLLPKSFSRVLAQVLAGVATLLYQYGNRAFLNIFIRTASAQPTTIGTQTLVPLIELGRELGVPDPSGATQAQLLINITVTNQTGSINSGEQLIGALNGVTYIVVGGVLLDAPVVQATVRAVQDQQGNGGEGTVGNLDPADAVSFSRPLANIQRSAVVVSQLVTSADAENIDVTYRQRVLEFSRARPQGGAYADYRIWGEEVAGIIRVYPFTGSPGEVDLYSEATEASSGSVDGIPTAAQLIAVFDSVTLDLNGLATRRSANTFINSLPITRQGFDVLVTGITGVADLAQTQTDITTAIDEYFLSRENFIVGLDFIPRKDRLTRSQILGIVEDVVTAAGGIFTTTTFNLTGLGGSIEAYVLLEGQKSKRVNIAFS